MPLFLLLPFFLGTVSSLLEVKQQGKEEEGEEEGEEEEGRSRVKQNKIFVFWEEENQMQMRQLGSFVLLFDRDGAIKSPFIPGCRSIVIGGTNGFFEGKQEPVFRDFLRDPYVCIAI